MTVQGAPTCVTEPAPTQQPLEFSPVGTMFPGGNTL